MSTPSSYRATFTYNTGSPKFNLNEYVTIGYTGTTSTAQAKITDLQYKSAQAYPYYVQLSNLTFTDGVIRPLTSLSSTSSSSISSIITTASGTIIQVYTLTDGDAVLNDGDISIQNNPIQTRANDIIDFTEVNPFGDTNDT